jgi:hypothetical protein
MEEIFAQLDADSEISAELAVMVSLDATLAADSGLTGALQLVVGISAVMDGNSGASSSLAGQQGLSAYCGGQAEFTANLSHSSDETQTIAGYSIFIVDSALVHVVNLSRGPQVPVPVKTVTIPVVKSLPFSPPASYSITTRKGRR